MLKYFHLTFFIENFNLIHIYGEILNLKCCTLSFKKARNAQNTLLLDFCLNFISVQLENKLETFACLHSWTMREKNLVYFNEILKKKMIKHMQSFLWKLVVLYLKQNVTRWVQFHWKKERILRTQKGSKEKKIIGEWKCLHTSFCLHSMNFSRYLSILMICTANTFMNK